MKRVSTVSGTTTTTVYIFSGGKVVAEYDNGALPSAPTREYIYTGARLIAKIDTATKYYHQDHLSNRAVTDSSGSVVAQMAHFPFGESWYNASTDKLTFTSYERDKESGNDYAKARYYISRLARFSSPDPVGGNSSNPQSWNRYSYVLNDPINLNDPEGEYCQWDDGTSDDAPEDGGASMDECTSQGGTWVPDSGSGGGGQDEACNGSCVLDQAKQSALIALGNPNCGEAVDGGSGTAQQALLDNMNGPLPPDIAPIASIGMTSNVGDLRPGVGGHTDVVGIAPPTLPGPVGVQANGFTSTITMNSDPAGYFMNPGAFNVATIPGATGTGYPNDIFQTIEMLHELGHVANNYFTPGLIGPDGPAIGGGFPGLMFSLFNTKRIEDNCFPQGDFGGNSGPLDPPPPVAAVIAKHHF